MGQLTNYTEKKLLDHVLKTASYSPPATVYLGLSTADPTHDGSGWANPTYITTSTIDLEVGAGGLITTAAGQTMTSDPLLLILRLLEEIVVAQIVTSEITLSEGVVGPPAVTPTLLELANKYFQGLSTADLKRQAPIWITPEEIASSNLLIPAEYWITAKDKAMLRGKAQGFFGPGNLREKAVQWVEGEEIAGQKLRDQAKKAA